MRPQETIDYHIKLAWHAIANLYNQLAAKHELTQATGFVLLNIDDKNGTAATKIAPLMGMQKTSLSRMLKNMENEGLICRKKDKLDGRQVNICLTEKGREKKKVDGQVRRSVKEFKKKCTDKREKAYARYKRFLELQKRNKDDIERYRIYEEKCDAEVEKFLELDEIEQVERKIKEAKQQIIDDSAKRITALFRGNMVYKRTNRLLQLNRNKKVLDIWAAETVQTWWRFVFARGIARQKRERKAFEDKSSIRLKYLRKLRGQKSAGDSREKLYLSRLDRIKLTDDNVKKVIDKFEEKVIKKLRLKEETITKIEKILEKKPRLEKRWNKYFPSVFKPPNWGKQDYTKPSVCLDRFFNDRTNKT